LYLTGYRCSSLAQEEVGKELDKNLKYHVYLDQVTEREKDLYNDISEVEGRFANLNELRDEVEGHGKFFLAGAF
jgi:hypothetical protein